MTPRVLVTDDLGTTAGDVLAEWIVATVAARGRCNLAVPGGTTPGPVFRRLVQVLSPAVRKVVQLGFVDERYVEWEDGPPPPGTNLRVALDNEIADCVGATVPLLVPGVSLDEAADIADRAVARVGRFDLMLMGVGPDGHVGSIFPDHASLMHAQTPARCVVAVRDSPKPPPERLTLTLPMITNVDHTVVIARGASKAPMLRRVWDRDPELPLTRAAPAAGWTWVLDAAAAADLPSLE